MFSSLNSFKRFSNHSTTVGCTKRWVSSKSKMTKRSFVALLSFRLRMNSLAGTSLHQTVHLNCTFPGWM